MSKSLNRKLSFKERCEEINRAALASGMNEYDAHVFACKTAAKEVK